MQEVEVDTNDLKEEDDGYDVEWGVLASWSSKNGGIWKALTLIFFFFQISLWLSYAIHSCGFKRLPSFLLYPFVILVSFL